MINVMKMGTVEHTVQLFQLSPYLVDILEAHFGKLSRVMDRNEFKLKSLYLTAIKELRRVLI